MNTSENTTDNIVAVDLRIEAERFYVLLSDGREIGVPYSWFWRLDQATTEQRQNWRFSGKGIGIHWEEVDEDISVKGILAGKPQNPSQPPRRQLAPA